jgi:acid phosphatase (class A)
VKGTIYEEIMMKKRLLAFLLTAVLLLPGFTATGFAKSATKSGGLSSSVADLTLLLAPPPAQDSEQTKAEIKELKNYQSARTKDQEAYAQADVEKSVFRFKNVLGDKFTGENLPLTTALFDKVIKVSKDTVDPAKDFYNRPRPFMFDATVKPAVTLDKSPSYPSGHATVGTVMAILLADMVPEKKAELYKRGWEYAQNRVIGGVHYRSDIEAGRISGTVIAALLLKDKKFAKEMEAAKAELRTALGY